MRTRIIVMAAAVVGAALIGVGATDALNLGVLLTEVEDAGRFETPARADLRIHIKEKEAGGERRYDGVVVHSGADVYLELREQAAHVIIRAGDPEVHHRSANAAGGSLRKTAQDPIGTTTLLADDFRPFRAGALRMPQITSETKRTVLVSGAPAEASPYVLLVYLLDREKRTPTRVQYYEGTVNNLVRMRRDTEFVRVAGVWRSTRTEIEDYRSGAVTTIERRWTPRPAVAEDLFDPATLATRTLLSPR